MNIEKVKRAMLSMARQCWEQGVAAQAMLECGDWEMLCLMARDCVVRQNADGRLCDVEATPAVVDPAVCVEPVLAAGRQLNDQAMIDAAMRNVAYLLNDAPATADGARYHLLGSQEIWADSMAMGPHVLMMNGCPDAGMDYYRALKRRLWDPVTGLYRHKWHEGRQVFTRGLYWGVGNGWALVGLMRMVRAMLDADDARADELAAEFAALVDAMTPYQADNGLFHDVLDDAATFYESETTEMFAYSIYNMVSWNKMEDRYLKRADQARRAVAARVDASGILQGSSGSPTFEREGTSVEAQAHFIMMEAAAHRLKR